MSTALRPVLRPQYLPSLPSSTATPTTYICHACRHARLLRRPKRPYTFTQLITLSDGSAFTLRTTSPIPVYRSTRDTRNAPLWNPSSKELASVEDDEAGRLAGFRARFGRTFDASTKSTATSTVKDAESTPFGEPSDASQVEAASEERVDKDGPVAQLQPQAQRAQARKQERERDIQFEDEKNEFEEDDMQLLDLISSFGRESGKQSGNKGKK